MVLCASNLKEFSIGKKTRRKKKSREREREGTSAVRFAMGRATSLQHECHSSALREDTFHTSNGLQSGLQKEKFSPKGVTFWKGQMSR